MKAAVEVLKSIIRARARKGVEEPVTRADARPVVYSLVSNPCTHDARVLKQAKSLLSAGYRVIIYARSDAQLRDHEVIDGLEFRRFACFDRNVGLSHPDREELFTIFGEDAKLLREKDDEDAAAMARYSLAKTQLAALKANAAGLEKKAAFQLKPIIKQKKDFLKQAGRERKEIAGANWPYLRHFYYAANLINQKLSETPSFIHSHDIFPLPGAIALARRTGASVIFDAHEIETERLPLLPPRAREYVDRLERRLLKQTDGMIVCCQSSAEFYQSRFQASLPAVVMNAPDMSQSDECSGALDIRAAAGLDPSTPTVIFVGKIGREARGLHLVTAALVFAPQFHFVVIGPLHTGDEEWLREAAVRSGVSDRVHILPPVPPDRVVAAIGSADVGICPIQDASLSYRYAMPNKLFEMAFAGVPICVSNLPEMARFVLNARIGVTMDQTDPQSIAGAIEEVYRNRAIYSPGAEGRAKLVRDFGWKKQEETLIRHYRTLSGARNVSRHLTIQPF